MKMLKFLCYKVQLIIHNIGNMINYNHDGWHDHDVISLHHSKHLWFLTTFVLSATKIHVKNTCLYILISLNPHLIVITKDYYACRSSPYNTN